MAKREAFLASEDVGSSLDAVEALIKKHKDFDKSLQAQVSHVLIPIPMLAILFHSHSIRVCTYYCPIPMLNCLPPFCTHYRRKR